MFFLSEESKISTVVYDSGMYEAFLWGVSHNDINVSDNSRNPCNKYNHSR